MAEVQGTQLIHKYLRHNKKFPHVFCPGCGHGIVLGSLVRSIDTLGLPKDDVCIVAGIGCSGRLAVYVDFNTVHTTHGRALTFATGIKMANPKMNVIVIMGDGDSMAIGGNHLIHAARRNIGVTALILNNNIYGMTGGQCSPTTPSGSYSMTTPLGQMEQSFDCVELCKAAKANYVARGSVFHAMKLDSMMMDAITNPGFGVLEIMSPCFTQFGRKNKFKSPVDMYQYLKKTVVPVDRYNGMDESARQGKIPSGVFVHNTEPGIEEKYYAMASQYQGGE